MKRPRRVSGQFSLRAILFIILLIALLIVSQLETMREWAGMMSGEEREWFEKHYLGSPGESGPPNRGLDLSAE
jgi:hypothetical protein